MLRLLRLQLRAAPRSSGWIARAHRVLCADGQPAGTRAEFGAGLPLEASQLFSASILASLTMWTVDMATWPGARRPESFAVSAALSLATGAASGVAILAATLPVRLASRSWARFLLSIAVGGFVAVLAVVQARVPLNRTALGVPALASITATVALMLALGVAHVTTGPGSRTSVPGRRLTVGLLGALGGALVCVDRTVLSPVVENAYSFVEGAAHLALTLSWASAVTCRARPRLRLATTVLSFIAAGWFAIFVGSRFVRLAVERSLPAMWEEPVYAARWLRRVRHVESVVAPTSMLARLGAKYELGSSYLDPAWNPAPRVPREVTPSSSSDSPWNVAVFFVDTLRADVANDKAVMPETVAWMEENIRFSRAYASASSTVLTLAPMLGCRYDVAPSDSARLLDTARTAQMKTGLVIPKSAADYHSWAFPAFRFDHETVVTDFDERRVSTANEIVDRSLTWVEQARSGPFFLWVYQFDVHAWGELDEAYVEAEAAKVTSPRDEGVHWRYRAAARGIDRAFTRFRAGLEALGVADRTIVVFVSDHGEGLGQKNFWAHSTYLWESLLRVPLALHVPNQPARLVEEPVSTIDLTPTLASLVGAPATDCHGIDLLSTTRPRPLPILFSAMIDGRLTRIGLLGGANRKLVVDLRDADARLLRVHDGSMAEDDISMEEPAELSLRLGELVRTPIYPRQ